MDFNQVKKAVQKFRKMITPTCKEFFQVHADIIDTLKKLDSLVYDIQYQAGNIVVDAINVSEKLKYILKKMQDNGEQE